MTLPKVPDTIQLRGVYHVKVRVPASIREHWGGKAIYQKSLKTADPNTAAREVRTIRAMMDAQTSKAQADSKLAELARFLPPDQKAILTRAGGTDGLLREFERGRVGLAFMQAGAPSDAPTFDIETGASGAPVKVHVGALSDPDETIIDRAAHGAALAAMRGQVNSSGRVLRQIGQDVDLIGDVFSLRDVLEKWAPGVDPQTADSARYYVRRFTEFHGEIPVTDLTRAHLRDFMAAIAALPKITSGKLKDGRFVRDLPLEEAARWAKTNNKETISEHTRVKNLDLLKRLMKFATEQDYRADDPWRGYVLPKVKVKHSETAKGERRPYTAAEVRKVLDHVTGSNAPTFARGTIDFWGPWIGAYHGLRLQEICQLRICDFADREGVFCMQITDEGEHMHAKSRASVRWVPVHPKLLEIGLQRLVEERGEDMPGTSTLFVEYDRKTQAMKELETDGRGRVSGNFGRRYGKLRRDKLGIVGGGVCFHSFRHTLQDAADSAGIPDSHRRYLTGRANKDAVEGGYGEGASMRTLFESVQKIDPTR